MYQTAFDKLIERASQGPYEAELHAARAEFFRFLGKVHEDEPTWESVTIAFLEWYLFERSTKAFGHPPIYDILTAETLLPEEASEVSLWDRTIPSLFEVRKISGGLKLRDCFTHKDYEVFERRKVIGYNEGDLVQTRLYPYKDITVHSTSFVVHPLSVKKGILKSVRAALKDENFDRRNALHILLCCRVNLDRHHAKVEEKSIYKPVLDGTWTLREVSGSDPEAV